MKCTHNFKYEGSYEDGEVYLRFEKCIDCGIDKTTEIDVSKYWDEDYEVAKELLGVAE